MGVHTVPKGITPKENVIVRLGFELDYSEVAVLHYSLLHEEFPNNKTDYKSTHTHTHTVIHRQTVSLYHNPSVRLDARDAPG